MEMNEIVEIGRELLYLAVLLSAPTVGISLLVGLVISILQTLTSIQEQTLTFAPRIMAVAVTLAFTLPWFLRLLISFTQTMFDKIGRVAY